MNQMSKTLGKLVFNSLGLSRRTNVINYFGRTCCVEAKKTIFVGKPAPNFKCKALVPSGGFKDIELKEYSGKYLVLFFYPFDFTFVCPTEVIAFSDRADEFRKLDCEVVGASCDSHFVHQAWTDVPRSKGGLGKLNIPLLADVSRSVSTSYDILVKEHGFPLRGLFIVDKKGILRHMCVNDTGVGRSVDETLRLVQAFKFVDEHGEVCPVNWKPGAKTIDTNKKNEFFKDSYKN